MNIQMKKGLLDSLVLSILNKGETYGYQLTSDLKRIVNVTDTALYPVLRRLQSQDYVTTFSKEYNGRLRKYYSITSKGIKALKANLVELNEVVKIIKYIEGGINDE
ncbi:PadR family transcriptional regulator [Mycoplasmatota bacterium]|nr:PadR family transcriptional regulator [Mycoplasmatota bacterium]